MLLGMKGNASKEWPAVIAHRGASAYAPENTLAAFVQADQCGATWVEFDVKLTADNILIVIHDDELSRTTNGWGKVVECTYEEIKALDAGGWFSTVFAGECVPTLEEVITCLGGYGMGANIEIKPNPGQAEQTTLATLSCVAEQWPETIVGPLISSFDVRCLQVAREHDPTVALGFLMDHWEEDWSDLPTQLQCVSVHVNHRHLTADRVRMIHDKGFKVMAYTVNKSTRAKQLWRWGVDTLFTDHPDKLLALL